MSSDGKWKQVTNKKGRGPGRGGRWGNQGKPTSNNWAQKKPDPRTKQTTVQPANPASPPPNDVDDTSPNPDTTTEPNQTTWIYEEAPDLDPNWINTNVPVLPLPVDAEPWVIEDPYDMKLTRLNVAARCEGVDRPTTARTMWEFHDMVKKETITEWVMSGTIEESDRPPNLKANGVRKLWKPFKHRTYLGAYS